MQTSVNRATPVLVAGPRIAHGHTPFTGELMSKDADMTRVATRYFLPALACLSVVAAACLTGTPASAQRAASIEGSWSGTGRVVLPSGDAERARCRVTFRKQSRSSYAMTATCATPSAKASQTGSVQRVAGTTYAGRFYNAEYNVSGSVRLTMRGSRITAALNGTNGASAVMTLAR